MLKTYIMNTESVASIGLGHIIFSVFFVKLARRPPPAPGGKVILYTLQKRDTRDKEGWVLFGQASFM